MCVDTLSSCLIRYHEARNLSLSISFCLTLSLRLTFLSCHLFLSHLPSSRLLPVRNFTWPPHQAPFFFLLVQKRKMIQTMEMSTYQLLVAISSRLPQSQIGPQIKYKTETHAYCIRMLSPFHESPNRFWHGISGGPAFMYILRFMKFQHMIKFDL